jgi:hypothetical protein
VISASARKRAAGVNSQWRNQDETNDRPLRVRKAIDAVGPLAINSSPMKLYGQT